MTTLILIIVWYISLIVSFLGGFYLSSKGIVRLKLKKPKNENLPLSQEEIEEQNLWSYNGRPQHITNTTGNGGIKNP